MLCWEKEVSHWLEIFCDFSTKSLAEMDIEEPQSFSNPFEKLWEHSNEQIVLQYVLGKWTRLGDFRRNIT